MALESEKAVKYRSPILRKERLQVDMNLLDMRYVCVLLCDMITKINANLFWSPGKSQEITYSQVSTTGIL